MGYPGAGGTGMGGGRGYPGGGRQSDDGEQSSTMQPPSLRLRWESALPVREAELKAHETSAPSVDSDHYAIAVYGVPNRLLDTDSDSASDRLKKQATMKLTGKKNWMPSSVQIIQRDEGTVVIYLFARTNEVIRSDSRLEFNAKIVRMQIVRNFYPEEMTIQGKLEL